jgi:hypothetical protein
MSEILCRSILNDTIKFSEASIVKDFCERTVTSIREVLHGACFICYLIKIVHLFRSMDNLITHCADTSYVYVLIRLYRTCELLICPHSMRMVGTLHCFFQLH